MDGKRWSGLLRNCNRSLLSFQIYASHQISEGRGGELDDLFLREIPVAIRDRIEIYEKKSFSPQKGVSRDQIFFEKDVLKTISHCFGVPPEEASRLFKGFNHLKESGAIARFTNADDQFLLRELEGRTTDGRSASGGILDCFFSDWTLMSKIYDFIMQEQLSLLDAVKFMYENVNFEKESSGLGSILRKICFGEPLWGLNSASDSASPRFNILDSLWNWYCRLVEDTYMEFEDPALERIFGGPLLQSYFRLLLESNLLHTILVVIQAQKAFLSSLPKDHAWVTGTASGSGSEGSSRKVSLAGSTPLNRCRLVLSELQSKCFLGSLYTLYSVGRGVEMGSLSLCDNALAHSASMINQLRQTASNGVLLASSLVLSLSPKELTIKNEDLGLLISIVVTILESLCSNEPGEVLLSIEQRNSFSTPARTRSLMSSGQSQNRQLSVRGNLLLAHAKVVKPLLPALIFSYASLVAQTPNRDSLLAPILETSTFFQSCAFTDSIEEILHALSSQNPLKHSISVNLPSTAHSRRNSGPASLETDTSLSLGESFGTYFQNLVLYSIIRSTISTFSLKTLPFVARISKHLSSLLRKEPRLVYRECWRGDYFRQIGVHLLLEMFVSFFPYGIIQFMDLLSSLVPDFNSISRLDQQDAEMAKQAFKVFTGFLRKPIKCVCFPPYLSSLGLALVPLERWNPDSVSRNSELPELPLHLEVSRLDPPNFALGASFSQTSLAGTLEGCLLDFLEIKLSDTTPLCTGFPAARKCLTPLRALPVGVAQTVPLRALLTECSETCFSSPLWANSPYGSSFDFPEPELPPFYHIQTGKNRPEAAGSPEVLDFDSLRLPSGFSSNAEEIKLGDLDPYTVQFCCKSPQGSDSLPSLLRIILLVWESIGLSFSQTIEELSAPQAEMLVSLTELIYRLVSFNPAVIFILEEEIFSWNALIPNGSQTGSKSSSRHGILTIKIIQTLKGVHSLTNCGSCDKEVLTVTFQALPRLLSLLGSSILPIDLQSLEEAMNGHVLKLQIVPPPSVSSSSSRSKTTTDELSALRDLGILPLWDHNSQEIPMYWLVPLLISGSNSAEILEAASQKDSGNYSPLLKGIQGFGMEEFFEIVSKSLEMVEKQLKSYPVTTQFLEFTGLLLKLCPVSFWGLGWDRHARLLLTFFLESSKSSPLAARLLKDLQLLLSDCILVQQLSSEVEQQKGIFGFFSKISHFSIHTVLSRIPSWQFNVESDRNLLLLRSLNVLSQLLDSMDSVTLVEADEDETGSLHPKNHRLEIKDGCPPRSLEELIPSISEIASSNHRALVATLLKHITETGLIPSLLAILSCEYSIHSQSLRKSRYSQTARDELDEIPAPWELLVSNSLVSRALTKDESLSCFLAIHLQYSNSQVLFLDKLLIHSFKCQNHLPDRSGELFSLPNVLIAQQVVTLVLEIIQKLLSSVTDFRLNSDLLSSLRTALVQWILAASPNQDSSSEGSSLFDPSNLSPSDSDIITQSINSKISALYQSKRPVMNLVKSLLSLMLSFVPESMPSITPILAARLLSSFCYVLSAEPPVSDQEQSPFQGLRSGVIVEKILSPPSSLCSIQQDFLLLLTSTKLFPLLIKILYQELDFILLAPVFVFLRTFDFSEIKISRQNNNLEMCRAALELITLFSACHPCLFVGPGGSLSIESLDQVLDSCRLSLTICPAKKTSGCPPSSNSRIGLICHSIVNLLSKLNSLLEEIAASPEPKVFQNLAEIMTLVPQSIHLLTHILENSRSRDLLLREMHFREKDGKNGISVLSVWKILVSLTRNLASFWSSFEVGKDSPEPHIYLKTIITSSITCIYHLTSRFISISTRLSFKNNNKLPVFLRERGIFDFIRFLVSDELICKIMYSKQNSGTVLDTFSRSKNHLQEIREKLGIPIKYCTFNSSRRYTENGSYFEQRRAYPENSLEQFVNRYYYERYLKFSHLVISNESLHNLTEFNISKIKEYQSSSSKYPGSSSFDSSNQSLKPPPSNNSETSQLATLEMVWESGQLLAPKHFSSNSLGFDKKEASESTPDESFIKRSVVTSRVKEHSEIFPGTTSRRKPGTSNLGNDLDSFPCLLSIRNSSFAHKNSRWGAEFELDTSAMLVLLSCSAAASLSIPHSELSIHALKAFSGRIIFETRRDNTSRSFLEAFMYSLASYNELLFYLKTLLPVVIAKFSPLISGSFLNELVVLFDSAKLNFLTYCTETTKVESNNLKLATDNPTDHPDFKERPTVRGQTCFPNIMMTILFSTCTDILSFDLVSNVRLILGRVEMIETMNSIKNLKSPIDLKNTLQADSTLLDAFPIAPNSSSVCLSSAFQDHSNPSKSSLGAEGKNRDFGSTVGNLVEYSPFSSFSEKNLKSSLRKSYSDLIEHCSRFIIGNLKIILSNQTDLVPVSIQAANGNLPIPFFEDFWGISSIQDSICSSVGKDSQEQETYLSCDLASGMFLLLFALKQLSSLSDSENSISSLQSSTSALLLELTSQCVQFYRKNGKTIHRLANDAGSNGTDSSLLNFLSSSLVALTILGMCIPAQILEVLYSENRKFLLRDLSSEFTLNVSSLKTPIITRIKELFISNPRLDEFNFDLAIKVLPLMDSVIQFSSSTLDKNDAPGYTRQKMLIGRGCLESIGFLKPPKVPFLSWTEAAHYSLLTSTMTCLAALSSTPRGCLIILKSGILVQMASNFFLSGWGPAMNSNSSKAPTWSAPSKHGIEISTHCTPFWPTTYILVELGDQTIRNPMHILWCRLISLASNVFHALSRSTARQICSENGGPSINRKSIISGVGGSEQRPPENSFLGNSFGIFSTISRNRARADTEKADRIESDLGSTSTLFKDDPQALEAAMKFIQLIEPRISLVLSEQRQISQLAMLEEFSLGVDLLRAILALNIPEFRSFLIETLRKALKTIRGISVVSLGRGITEAFDLFKPISRLEKNSACHNLETLDALHLDSFPAQVPSVFHQRCCIILLNSIRSIIDTFVSDSGFSLELRGGRELLMQLFHDTMDLCRPILQLLEDIPNHYYAVFTVIKTKSGESLLPVSLNVQALHPSEPSASELTPDSKSPSLSRNCLQYKGVARISAVSESCCLPEMITFDSFAHLLSSLIDLFTICGAKCLYTLESLEATDQHNDTVRRFLEFLHLSQGLNSSFLLESSKKLIEKVYANLKSRLGDQINVDVVGLVGIKKDPIHALLFERLSNTSSNQNSGM
ncbi:putative membrane protein [Cryptosporidium felis]|nr:putative membrane protein [Cryptosporidium felis]